MMLADFNTLRQDHPSYGTPSSETAGAEGAKHYTGDFNSKSADIPKLVGFLWYDGNYTLPPELKTVALDVGTRLLELEKRSIKTMLPGISVNPGTGEPAAENVASYLLAMAMETYRPNNMQRVLNPRKYGAPREVESKFTNSFDTSKPLNEAGLSVARQIYGDNYDKSLGTTNPSDDLTFIKQMQKLLPPPGR